MTFPSKTKQFILKNSSFQQEDQFMTRKAEKSKWGAKCVPLRYEKAKWGTVGNPGSNICVTFYNYNEEHIIFVEK